MYLIIHCTDDNPRNKDLERILRESTGTPLHPHSAPGPDFCIALSHHWKIQADGNHWVAILGCPYLDSDFSPDLIRLLTEASISRLRGQYLILHGCKSDKTLCIYRDSYGKYPLFVGQNNENVVVASQPGLVQSALGLRPRLSLSALRRFHQSLTLDTGETLHSAVTELGPGTSSMQIHLSSKLSIHHSRMLGHARYAFSTRHPPYERFRSEFMTALGVTLAAATSKHDAILALSGGRDSNLLRAVAIRSDLALPSSHTSFAGLGCDETRVVNEVGNYGTARQPITICRPDRPCFDANQEDIFAVSDHVPWPVSHSLLPCLDEAVTRGLSRMLDGTGGDELFNWPLGHAARASYRMGDILASLRVLPSLEGVSTRRKIRTLIRTVMTVLFAKPHLRYIFPNRHFLLAAQQLCWSKNIDLTSPLCDPALIRMMQPVLPWGAFLDGKYRNLEDRLIEETGIYPKELSFLKANFSEVARVQARGNLNLGEPGNIPFSDLVPAFADFKIREQGYSLDDDT